MSTKRPPSLHRQHRAARREADYIVRQSTGQDLTGVSVLHVESDEMAAGAQQHELMDLRTLDASALPGLDRALRERMRTGSISGYSLLAPTLSAFDVGEVQEHAFVMLALTSAAAGTRASYALVRATRKGRRLAHWQKLGDDELARLLAPAAPEPERCEHSNNAAPSLDTCAAKR